MTETTTPPSHPDRAIPLWVYDLLMVGVLLLGAFFRFSGIYWGEYQYLHPDERFLVWVGTDISPVGSIGEYFDTANSSLNPHNRGHGFYVYGTFPMFIARYLAEWIFGHSSFQVMTEVGRPLSALVDLLGVFLVYLVAEKLYDRRVAILAGLFSAATALLIQQSHFFTMDTFMNAFSFLAFYFAVRIVVARGYPAAGDAGQIPGETPDLQYAVHNTLSGARNAPSRLFSSFAQDPLFLPSLGFGIALGMAVSSKLNAAPMAFVLPAAALVHLLRLPPAQRERRALQVFVYLALAGALSLLVFRVLQPYAFSGPDFLGVMPNPKWLDNLRSLRAQSGGDVDFPPAMQWARRPIWFSFQNMLLWGLGLPFGLLAWAGFLWVGWRLLTRWKRDREEWLRHTLIWGWTAVYFTWQSLALNPTMRYQLPIYPTLAIFAAWAIVALYDYRNSSAPHPAPTSNRARLAAVTLGGLALLATLAYAYAFSRIYTRPITRVAASHWIYQNIPGPISLPIQTGQGVYNQSLPVPYSLTITPNTPFSTSFQPKAEGELAQVYLPRLRDEQAEHKVRQLSLSISAVPSEGAPLATAVLVDDLTASEDPRGRSYLLDLDRPLRLEPDKTYNLRLELPGQELPDVTLANELVLRIQPVAEDADSLEQTLYEPAAAGQAPVPFSAEFMGETDGALTHIYVRQLAVDGEAVQDNASLLANLQVSLRIPGVDVDELSAALEIQPAPDATGYLLALDAPLPIVKDEIHLLSIELAPEGGVISLSGLGLANEGEWDDGLPLRLDGYDGFGGIYPLDLDFNMYWDDNPEKLERFTRILDQADYIAISSSRQWGSLPRIPERFPLTSLYYRNLLGCPPQQVIEYCYNVAEPGMFQGELGYELVATFDSSPAIGSLTINDQFAEEAFTVYDHPKVFIFKKRADYDSERVRAILGSVDFSRVERIAPMKFPDRPIHLTLPDYRLAEQRAGGTWSELFDTAALHNRFQPLGVLLWYLSLGLLGLLVYPLLRLATPGLADHAYPLARTVGMLLLSYLVWIASSLRIPFTRPTISVALAALALLGGVLAYRQRRELLQELRQRRRYFLLVEGLALAFFLAFLLVRLGNPDLWHPAKGGEKPMDFSYFNAVLKSTSFPPYDPWYAGGYLNYYYYGFVLVGVLVKWLGITPAVAYNLVLPSLFSMIAMGAFSLAWNLSCGRAHVNETSATSLASSAPPQAVPFFSFVSAISAALGTAVLGNLGVPRMIFQGYQKLVAPDGIIEGAGLLVRWGWALRGFVKVLGGARLPYSMGDWYWIPSRAIPALGDVEPITEFPYFTVLYADLHPHLLALPLTLLALVLVAAMVLGRACWKSAAGALAWFFLAVLAIGALLPTNTWDMPVYLVLGILAVGYALWRYYRPSTKTLDTLTLLAGLPEIALRALVVLGGAALLVVLAFLLYQPYADWYALGYTKIDLWKGAHTPLSAYFTHWGLFLLLIVSWMAWETRDWMARTPLSALRKLAPYRWRIQAALIVLVLVSAGLTLGVQVHIAWLVLPLAAWAAVLLLRPGQQDAKRIVLFLVGSSLVLTLMVEIIVLRGDIGRMNTVFKFYLQAWTMFSISAAAALGWLLPELPQWLPGWRRAWGLALMLLVAGASLYPLMATMAKIKDRMAEQAPHTLDGMAFMAYAEYVDQWGRMDLAYDYRAIRWLQENVEASPVIVEANLRDLYRWGSRYTIYTGLPGVAGWEWHQQQQRAVVSGIWVSERIAEIDDFYQTTDLIQATDFLRKYDVRYIILGQQERGKYPGPGLDKFEAADGLLWREVYRQDDVLNYQDTVIYEVLP
ncbi:MAG: glycosyltransferase family 39 protein [Anaerolineales bacterium]|nr:glycosyltransferase family 39 protein [Anaerolineales bacterium]